MRLNSLHIILGIIALLSPHTSFCEDKGFRVVCYNVENLFDCEDDPMTDDDSFTEKGEHQWTKDKYRKKLLNISKALVAAGEWKTPAIIGLCEIENRKVLKDLTSYTPLSYANYKIVHKDSPDKRGVDVALLYREDDFNLIRERFLHVDVGERPTRDVLWATGIVKSSGDTLHLFVNHWPSRYGGELESEEKRKATAKVVRTAVDSIFKRNTSANIIIMGDFNDYSNNESLTHTLGCINQWTEPKDSSLYNLCYQFDGQELIGSHKYGGRWGVLDHLIISGNLLKQDSNINTDLAKVGICNQRFLLKKDLSDYAPKRAFLGSFFAGGFSDHLPVYVDFTIKSKD